MHHGDELDTPTSQGGVQHAVYHYVLAEWALFTICCTACSIIKIHPYYGQNNTEIENVRDILGILFDSYQHNTGNTEKANKPIWTK